MRSVLLMSCTIQLLLSVACTRPPAEEHAKNSSTKKPQSATVLDEAAVEGTKLRILGLDDVCTLEIDGTRSRLRPKAPCFFLRRGGTLQTFAYKKAGVEWAVVVAGTPVRQDYRKAWNLREGDICGEEMQGVLRKDERTAVTESVHSGGVYCRDHGVDEKEFWSFAHGR